MERVTFHRADVNALLAGMVCMKVNATDGHPVATKFGVRAFPTLVLIEPTGDELYHDSGAPAPDVFAKFFAVDAYNAMVDAYNRKDWNATVPHFLRLRTYFKDTELGQEAEKLFRNVSTEDGFTAAYEAAAKAYADRVAKVQAKLVEQRKRAERREKAQAMVKEADALYAKYRRTESYKFYKRIILEYADLPEADHARAILKKHHQKWEEPE